MDHTGEFSEIHDVFIMDPGAIDPAQFDETTMGCRVDEQHQLRCSVQDQDVLQLFEDRLKIANFASIGMTQSNFTLVQLA